MNKTKYFCIGLHKTGTSSLHEYAKNNKLKSTHSTDWQNNTKEIYNFDFFCDGGSHYDNQNEIDYHNLHKTYLNSVFIINIREIKSWIISKLKHAGWRINTEIIPNRNFYKHNQWREKSMNNIKLFITHYYNRYIKILEYFLNKQDKAYIINISNNRIKNLKIIFNCDNLNMYHANKGNKNNLSKKVLDFIDNEIYVVNKDKQEKLLSLINQYKY